MEEDCALTFPNFEHLFAVVLGNSDSGKGAHYLSH
jgi:hypothetical protein